MARSVRQTAGFDGARLLEARERSGMTRAELARRLQTGWEVVAQWETGECQPRPRTIPAIAAAVGVPTTDLYPLALGEATLAERRVAAGLNQADIANALGVNRATISQWERGGRPVPARHRSAYRRLLGFADGEGQAPTSAAGERSVPSPTTANSSASPPKTSPPHRAVPEEPVGLQSALGPETVRPGHVIVVTDLEYSGSQFLGGDGRPRRWRVYSPQGVTVNKTTEPDLEPLMDNAVSRLIELGYRQVCLHHEQRVIIDDEPVRIVRYQTSPPSETREHQARLFLSHFAPEFYWEGQGEDPEEKARIRKEFATCFPQSASGDMLFVIAEATDIYGWLQDQTVPYTPYTIIAHLPQLGRHFFAAVHHDHTSVKTEVGLVSMDELGVRGDTTVQEMAEKLRMYFQQ